jgi:hypothetical protein
MDIIEVERGNLSLKQIKDSVRPHVVAFLMETLVAAIGEERVSQVGNSEIAFSIADTTSTDENGNQITVEIPVHLDVTMKDFEKWFTSKGDEREPYDRVKAEDDYNEECDKKAREKAERAAKKAKQIAKDKANREKKKENGE